MKPSRPVLPRRDFLVGVGATAAALSWPACSSSPGPVASATPFERLKVLKELVRSSSDHLAARAAPLIAAKDPTAAVRFVRDNLVVLPPPTSTDTGTDGVRWGPTATLRSGAGTLRERAEVLRAMLESMGATARLRSAALPAEVTSAALNLVPVPHFAPDLKKEASFSSTTDGPLLSKFNTPPVDADPSGVVSALLGLLPAGAAATAQPFDGLDARVPVVEYVWQGDTRWAYALGNVDEVDTAPASLGAELSAVTYPQVSARLLALMGDLPGAATPPTLVELVAGSWSAEQLAGKRLTLACPSPTPEATANAPIDSVGLRMPVMSVQAAPDRGSELWFPRAESALPAIAGAPFTLDGARFTSLANQSVAPEGPYGAFIQLDATAHAAALAKVASLEVLAQAGAFPDVQLTVAALDASGAPVAGLSAADFGASDEGAPQAFTLLSNAGVELPRVLLAYDCSGSITWENDTTEKAFAAALDAALVDAANAAPYLLAVAPLGDPAGDFVPPTSNGIRAKLTNCNSASDLWTSLGDVALAAGATAVVVVSDFIDSDVAEEIPALQKRVAGSGLSVAVVPISTSVEQATIDAVVRVAGAVKFDAKASTFSAALRDFVAQATRRARASPYRLRYRVPVDQQGAQTTRTAKVSLPQRSLSGSGGYAVPALDVRGVAGVGGLYLELTLNGATETRRLSGPPLNRFGRVSELPTAAHFEETRDLLNGVTTVAFEPGSPTTGANLDDLLSSLGSLEPLAQKVGAPKAEALTAGQALSLYSGALAVLVDPLRPPGGAALRVAPRGLTTVVMTESAGYHGFSRRLDVVPSLNLANAAGLDAAAAFRATMTATVGLSLREGVAAVNSAAGALAGASLQYLAPYAPATGLPGYSPQEVARWTPVLDQYPTFHRFLPTDPTKSALWLTEPKTGSTFAVLLDGRGGADCTNAKWNADLQEALAALSLYASYKSLVCSMPEVGPFACVGGNVASVGAGVASFFSAAVLDTVGFTDIWTLVVTIISTNLPSGLSAALTLLEIVQTYYASKQSLADHC